LSATRKSFNDNSTWLPAEQELPAAGFWTGARILFVLGVQLGALQDCLDIPKNKNIFTKFDGGRYLSKLA